MSHDQPEPSTEPRAGRVRGSNADPIRDVPIQRIEVQGLFALWKYDEFPYITGGAISHIDWRGFVTASGYGGASFKPLLIVPSARGEQILRATRDLKVRYAQAREELHRDYLLRLQAAIPSPDELLPSRVLEQAHTPAQEPDDE